MAYEFLQEHPELDIMMAPVGGGGLLSEHVKHQRIESQYSRVWM